MLVARKLIATIGIILKNKSNMKNKLLKWVTAIVTVVFFAGCASNAHIEKDKNADFSKYRTYAWVSKQNKKKKKKNEIAETNARNAVNAELQKRGWSEVSRKPDVLLNYELMVEKNKVQQQDPVYTQPYSRSYYSRRTGRIHTFYYPAQFVGYDNYSTTVKEATVTVTMIDNDTDKTVWQGWTTSELNSGRITSNEVERSVKTIFKKFEVGK